MYIYSSPSRAATLSDDHLSEETPANIVCALKQRAKVESLGSFTPRLVDVLL